MLKGIKNKRVCYSIACISENILGYSNVNILRCCNGGFYSKSRQKFVNVKQAYGYKWRKINE